MEKNFGVIHKTTGLFFGGFDAEKNVKWVEQSLAERMVKEDASLQAKLFASFGVEAQKKPVSI